MHQIQSLRRWRTVAEDIDIRPSRLQIARERHGPAHAAVQDIVNCDLQVRFIGNARLQMVGEIYPPASPAGQVFPNSEECVALCRITPTVWANSLAGGEDYLPAHPRRLRDAVQSIVEPIARLPSNTMRSASAPVSTFRFVRRRAGSRYPTAVELRRPLRVEYCNQPTPS